MTGLGSKGMASDSLRSVQGTVGGKDEVEAKAGAEREEEEEWSLSSSPSSPSSSGRRTAVKEGRERRLPSSSSPSSAFEIASRALFSSSRCLGSSGIGRNASHLWPGRAVEVEEEEVGEEEMPSQRRTALAMPSPRLTSALAAARVASWGRFDLAASTERTKIAAATRQRASDEAKEEVDGRRGMVTL